MSTVDREPLTLVSWDHADAEVHRARAAEVAAAVGGQLVELEVDAQGGQLHQVAVIDVRGVHMVLVPGGTVTLGWDPSRPHGLTPRQEAALLGDGASSAIEVLTTYLTPTRTVTLAPFLVEIAPRSCADWLDGVGDDPLADVSARVATEGFRLLTDDEWEHAVRGGSTALFRWGDVWPDGIPFAHETHFTAHHVPTAFGLRLLDDPYQVEVVDAPLGFRGGDGGGFVCGGRPAPVPWLSFASAFRWPSALWSDCVDEALATGFVRRALTVP